MQPTIKDVACEAGVSVATVSRFINKSGKLRDATSARVQSAIDTLGFRPNAVGRNLSTAHTQSLGVIIPSLSNPVFADAVAGINAEAHANGYTLMFTVTDYKFEEELRTVGALLEYRVDGLILIVADPDHSPALDMLEAAGTPYVLIYNQPTGRNRPTVTVDNVAAGAQAAQTFFDLGHERLAMISGKFSASDRAHARRRGFLHGAAARGLAEPLVFEVDFIDSNVADVLKPLYVDRQTAPTALFCSNDLLAISVIGALGRMNLNVPHDVSVIGFDGIAVGTHLHPTLATVLQPSREMGQTATRQLLGRLKGEEPPSTVILPHILRLGESAGPATKHGTTDLPPPLQSEQRNTTS